MALIFRMFLFSTFLLSVFEMPIASIPTDGKYVLNDSHVVVKKGMEVEDYGPKLPEGEDGQANLEIGNRIWTILMVSGVILSVIALITIMSGNGGN